MIVVRSTFICKPGNASKLAALFKEAGALGKLPEHRILTDVTGEFNRVVLEYTVKDLGGFEAEMKEYQTNEALREKMKGYTDLYLTGSREIFRIV